MKKIAIIGTAPSRLLAPFEDMEWDMWACSPGNQNQLPRVTVWFEMHSVETMLRHADSKGWAPQYFRWLQECTFPVVMIKKNDAVPKADIYPIAKMVEKYGRNFWASSVAYMLALAIEKMEAGDTIGIFGVDMAAGQEDYSNQKLSCLYFIDKAREKGINVEIPLESSLAQPSPMYGYDEETPLGRRLQAVLYDMVATRNRLQQEMQQKNLEAAYISGAIEQVQYMQRTFVPGHEAADLDPLPVEVKMAEIKVEDERLASLPPEVKVFSPPTQERWPVDSGSLPRAGNGIDHNPPPPPARKRKQGEKSARA